MAGINVMISSRCVDEVPDGKTTVSLSDVRCRLQEGIQRILADGSKRAFDVWISETGDPGPGNKDAWDVCMDEARACTIFICLYNGNSGWAPQGSIGICHAELQTAMNAAPEKVRLVAIEPLRMRDKPPDADRDLRFKSYVDQLNRYRGRAAVDAAGIRRMTHAALRDAVVQLTSVGGSATRMRAAYQGEALDWNRLDFPHRRDRMVGALMTELLGRRGARQVGEEAAVVEIAGKPVLFLCHAIPAAMSVAPARELTGQPFLHDHEHLSTEGAAGGPVHLIACYGNVTDAQARRQLGFPDAMVVSPPFGVWVADPVQKIQMLFLAGCVDSSSTEHLAQRAFEWFATTGEDTELAARAVSRAKIVRTIAKEVAAGAPTAPSGSSARPNARARKASKRRPR